MGKTFRRLPRIRIYTISVVNKHFQSHRQIPRTWSTRNRTTKKTLATGNGFSIFGKSTVRSLSPNLEDPGDGVAERLKTNELLKLVVRARSHRGYFWGWRLPAWTTWRASKSTVRHVTSIVNKYCTDCTVSVCISRGHHWPILISAMLWEYLACLGKSTVCAPKSHGLETLMATKTSSTVAKCCSCSSTYVCWN
jgi:hypothetical protein